MQNNLAGEVIVTLRADVVKDAGDWSQYGASDEIKHVVDRSIAAVLASQTASRRLPSAPAGLEVAIVLSNDVSIAELNAQFRGKAGPTNVLSFPAPDQFAQINPGEPRPLGDVVLALETILGEAVQLSRT
ncbi:MAG: rRNA maturation RNase YbeY, partial [Hyphomicrobiaceae bacterium]